MIGQNSQMHRDPTKEEWHTAHGQQDGAGALYANSVQGSRSFRLTYVAPSTPWSCQLMPETPRVKINRYEAP